MVDFILNDPPGSVGQLGPCAVVPFVEESKSEMNVCWPSPSLEVIKQRNANQVLAQASMPWGGDPPRGVFQDEAEVPAQDLRALTAAGALVWLFWCGCARQIRRFGANKNNCGVCMCLLRVVRRMQ